MLWDLSHPCIDDICIAWHKGLDMLGLPGHTHSSLLAPFTNRSEMTCSVPPLCFCLNVFVARIILLVLFLSMACVLEG